MAKSRSHRGEMGPLPLPKPPGKSKPQRPSMLDNFKQIKQDILKKRLRDGTGK